MDWSEKELTPELLHAWRSRMRRWCARELGTAYASRMDTSDVVQESMLQVWQDWSRFRGSSVGEVKSWLFRIARGHLHKARRHHRAAKRNVFTEAGELLEGGYADHGDPGEAAARREDRGAPASTIHCDRTHIQSRVRSLSTAGRREGACAWEGTRSIVCMKRTARWTRA